MTKRGWVLSDPGISRYRSSIDILLARAFLEFFREKMLEKGT